MPADLHALAGALTLETASLDAVLDGLTDADWTRPTPAPGWSIADQVSHLAYFDEMAVLSARDRVAFEALRDAAPPDADRITERVAREHRHLTPVELRAWFARARAELDTAFRGLDPSARVPWYGPDMSVAAALTARIMETWAHGLDVADTVGAPWPATVALRQVAHLGVRARANSFRARGRPEPDTPVRVELTGPGGETWGWGPEDAADRIAGTAFDFCLVVTQRRHVDDTGLVAVGPGAREWLTIAQAFAGPPGAGRAPATKGGAR